MEIAEAINNLNDSRGTVHGSAFESCVDSSKHLDKLRPVSFSSG